MGPLEAYLGAGLFHLFGPSLFTLRLGLVLRFVLFLFVCTYLLTSLLYTEKISRLRADTFEFRLKSGADAAVARHWRLS